MSRNPAAAEMYAAADALRAASARSSLALRQHGDTPHVRALHEAEAQAREALARAELAYLDAILEDRRP